MVSPYEGLLDQAMAAYQRQRQKSGELYRELNHITETVTAPRQVVKVTVGQQGEVTDLTFPTAAFKNMTGTELATVILKTIGQAQSQLRARSATLLAPSLPAGLSAEELLAGTADLEALLPARPWNAEDADQPFGESGATGR